MGSLISVPPASNDWDANLDRLTQIEKEQHSVLAQPDTYRIRFTEYRLRKGWEVVMENLRGILKHTKFIDHSGDEIRMGRAFGLQEHQQRWEILTRAQKNHGRPFAETDLLSGAEAV